MHDFIMRLTARGLRRKTAVFVCDYYNQCGKTAELARYVETVERACENV